jgi:N6-L-threonylcarbamoyladenine synthase
MHPETPPPAPAQGVGASLSGWADRSFVVLGVESSCDDTAAALVRMDPQGATILADIVAGQADVHAGFGGVAPEAAARAHAERLDTVTARALQQAGLGLDSVDAVAATAGPGLIGGVIAGLVFAKAVALARGLPLVAVNHLEGHALSPRLVDPVAFPYLLLLVSGGHTQLLVVEGVGRYVRLGTTIDDAAGEAFDKAARVLGLGFPGGPAIDRLAGTGRPARFRLPRPLLGRPEPEFSFAGLKTAVQRVAAELPAPLDEADRADLAASFQQAVADVIEDRVMRAVTLFVDGWRPDRLRLVAAGGVAANSAIRARLMALAERQGGQFVAPPARLCTDNAAMIAFAGGERLRAGLGRQTGGLDAAARPRWPLDQANPLMATGRKGARA